MERTAIIIDGYHLRDGGYSGFAGAFRARGVRPITIMSTPAPLPKLVKKGTWHPEDFDEVHFYDGDFDRLLRFAGALDPIAIVAENECGVELTASLVEVLMPQIGNVPGSARAQRDKGEMARALERAGVPGALTICTDEPAAVTDWIRRNGLENRSLVVKPSHSSATDNVYRVNRGEDWQRYFSAVLGQLDTFEVRNDTVVVQEYLEGPEYIVDLYSVDGKHGLVDTCVYTKHNRGSRVGIYDRADFLPPDHPQVAILAEYTKQAASAVGIRNGSTHAEVIMTSAGPRLVDLGARYSGSCMMLSGHLATGDNQVERTIRHLLDGEFTPGFDLLTEVRTLWLRAEFAGPVHDAEILQEIRELPTVNRMSIPENGKVVPMTNDASTRFGWVIQSAADWPAIERDTAHIKELERTWNARQLDRIARSA